MNFKTFQQHLHESREPLVLFASIGSRGNILEESEYHKQMEKLHDDLMDHYDHSRGMFNHSDTGVLALYKGATSTKINRELFQRHKELRDFGFHTDHNIADKDFEDFPIRHEKEVKRLDHFTRHQHKTPQNLTLYSGIGTRSVHDDMISDRIVHLPAFTSTSLSPKVASNFSSQHVLEIHWPKGSSGTYMEHFENPHHQRREYEMLLPRNLRLRVDPKPVEYMGRKIWGAEPIHGHDFDLKKPNHMDFWGN